MLVFIYVFSKKREWKMMCINYFIRCISPNVKIRHIYLTNSLVLNNEEEVSSSFI